MEREIAQWVHHAGSRLRDEIAEKLTACRFVGVGARCSSIKRMFVYCAISRSTQCSTTGVTKAVVCALSCLWDGAYKRTLAVYRT